MDECHPIISEFTRSASNARLLADLQEDKRITPALVAQGFHMAPIRKRPGGFEGSEQELEEGQEMQTEYEDASVRRQRAKKKDIQEACSSQYASYESVSWLHSRTLFL